MKQFLKTIRLFLAGLLVGILTFTVIGGFVLAANVFPTTLNEWSAGDVIEEGWANELEYKIGIDNSASSTSLDYLIKHSGSVLGAIASQSTTTGQILVTTQAGNWEATTTLTIDTNGNVGVGSTTPGTLLSVGGIISANTLNITNPLAIIYGGTATTTIVEGNLLMGDPSGNYTLVASSTLAGGTESNWSLDATGTALYATSTIEYLSVGTVAPAFGLEIQASSSIGYFGVSNVGEGDIFKIDENGNITVGTWQGTAIAAGYYAAGSIDGDDINSNVAGRSLTLTSASPDTLDADAELYTDMDTIILTNATSTQNPVAQLKYATAITITRISCSVDNGTTTIQFDERAESTPNSAGTDVMNAGLVCDTDTQATTTFANAGIAVDVPLSLDVDNITGNTTTSVRIHIDYTYND